MKKYSLLLLFVINALNCMENVEHAYLALRSSAFSYFLDTYNVQTEGRAILHIECATGKLSAKLAKKATRIHGFDRNERHINCAKDTYGNRKNISFEYCPSITFNFPRMCDLAIIDYTTVDCYNNTNENKKELFQCVNQHLSENGEMFISIVTSDNTLHPNIATAMNMTATIQAIIPNTTEERIIELMMPSYPSLQELLTILEETGFEVITSKEEICCVVIPKSCQNKLWNIYSNLIVQNPIFEHIQDHDTQVELGKQFVQRYINTLKKDNDGNLLEPTITTIIHARKK
jgi:2-polyprenyl-3-methyl-5-hydroxy-6-metoxy-1,4-benzoquinol methylase